MTYALVRPSSLPYDGSAYSDLFGVTSTRPATPGAGGMSLADDSDDTSVTLASSQDSSGYQATIVAVDFDAVPGFVADSDFGTMFRIERLADEPADVLFADDSWALINHAGEQVGVGRMSDAVGSIYRVPMSTPTTYEAGPDWYGFSVADPGLQAQPFTLAFCIRAGASDSSTSATDLYAVFECGLFLDIGTAPTGTLHVPPLRLHPRSDGRGMSSAQRVWPRPPTGAYGRIGPGSLI